jgi:hypothetical protein
MKKLFILMSFLLMTFMGLAQITSPYGTFVGCRPTSITLQAPSGYASYLWSNGDTTKNIEYVLVGTGSQILDTATVSVTCFDQSGNSFPQNPVVVRSIREPQLLSNFNKVYNYAIKDSIKCELVLTYLYPTQYVFTFIQTDTRKYGQVKFSKYVSSNRWCDLSKVYPALEPGKYYHVTVHARVNNINYCKGNYGEIGLAKSSSCSKKELNYNPIDIEVFPNPSKENFQVIIDSDSKKSMNVSIFDMSGKLVYENNYDNFPIYENVSTILNSGIYKLVTNQDGNIKSVTLEKF